MNQSITPQIIIFICLLLSSSFFSASETSLSSLSKIRIRQLVDDGVKNAKTVHILTSNPEKMLATILVSNNVVNIAASSLATAFAISTFGNAALGIVTGIVTILILIIGEILPKSFATKNSEMLALKVAKPIYYLSILLTPITNAFSVITRFVLKFFGGNNGNITTVTENEIRTMIDVSHEEGGLEISEKEMIQNVFEFNDTYAKDIMIQRFDIVAVNDKSSYEEVMKLFKKEQYSRIPVYSENIENIIGVLNLKDLAFVDNKSNFKIKDYMREVFYTIDFKKIDEVFNEMKENRMSMAIVVNEYGSTVGLLTLENLIEEIVGDIEDEYDEKSREILVIKEDEYVIKGWAKIDKVNDLIGTKFESETVDTIAGYLIEKLGFIPKKSETYEFDNIKFIIIDADDKKLKLIKVLTI